MGAGAPLRFPSVAQSAPQHQRAGRRSCAPSGLPGVKSVSEARDRQAGHDMKGVVLRLGPALERVCEPSGGKELHRVVVVGGGAGGLELVTRLGDRLGRRSRASVTLVDCARTHLWKPLLHAVAAGSLDPGENEVDYLAQAHWHGFRYRFGAMSGLDRAWTEVHLAAAFAGEGREVTVLPSAG